MKAVPIRQIVLVSVLLVGVAAVASAQQKAPAGSDEVEQKLEEQDRTIRELKKRVEDLEAGQRSEEQPAAQGPAPATTKPGEAPSPMEEKEAELGVRYGRPSRVSDRGAYDDRQTAAARPSDYTLDPAYRGFIPVPRTVLMIKFNAVPRVDLNMTSADPGNEFRFVPAQFPTQPGSGGGWRFNANGNGSQLRVDVQAPAVAGNFRFYYQNDFFGSDTRNMQYRLQHLYGEFYGVVGGFTYGVFEDPDAWPDTVDYEGPNSVIFARRPLLHYTRALSDDWQLTVGIEDPNTFIDTTGDPGASRRARAPDGGFNVRWTPGELGHVQFSTLFRSVGIDGGTFPNQDVLGWGVNVAGVFSITPRDTAQVWLVYGNGIGGMGNDTSFVDSDAALDSAGHLLALRYWSALAAVTHRWTPRWRSTATYGYVNLENTDLQSPGAFHVSHYASANVIYQVFKRMSVGLEGLYGRKVANNGDAADVFRIQLGVSFRIFD